MGRTRKSTTYPDTLTLNIGNGKAFRLVVRYNYAARSCDFCLCPQTALAREQLGAAYNTLQQAKFRPLEEAMDAEYGLNYISKTPDNLFEAHLGHQDGFVNAIMPSATLLEGIPLKMELTRQQIFRIRNFCLYAKWPSEPPLAKTFSAPAPTSDTVITATDINRAVKIIRDEVWMEQHSVIEACFANNVRRAQMLNTLREFIDSWAYTLMESKKPGTLGILMPDFAGSSIPPEKRQAHLKKDALGALRLSHKKLLRELTEDLQLPRHESVELLRGLTACIRQKTAKHFGEIPVRE